jgi:transcriptional regulator with XRE-family HTH domain
MRTAELLRRSAGRVSYDGAAARRTRERARLTQAEVGSAVGVNAATISRWEGGSRQPRGDAGDRYVRLLDRLTVEVGS